MSKLSNLNYNHISVKPDSTVKLIKELSKLGVFRKKSKRRPKSSVSDSIRQDSDMVGYVKTLDGPQMRNFAPIQQITAGMTQNQIEDIQRRNDATLAALRGEVQQQRLEDIEAQQGQRFADITRFGEIINPVLERFRSSQESGAGQRIDPFNQSSKPILLPDVTEERFTQTINEGGPEAEEQQQTNTYTVEDNAGIASGGGGIPEPRIQPLGRIKPGKPTRTQFLAVNGLSPLPPNNKLTTLQDMRAYYSDFNQTFALDDNSSIYNNKGGMYTQMVADLDDLINLSI
jgi:hypothetical protein